ncbi:hypothetical protein CLIB1444_04S02102 [[Candida] jaroonii]|uniref:Uncharacterized protein n=1 Tax=[Candida] jaroonii TaxID=467808 RepID=A0ACA9Y689_9ASCO|nr:hypothetical protein CLIB1444_04S02102 [[Candida] jaroonii]
MKQTYSIERLLALKEPHPPLDNDKVELLKVFAEEVSRAKERIELPQRFKSGANYETSFNKPQSYTDYWNLKGSPGYSDSVPMLFSSPSYHPQPYMFQQTGGNLPMISFDDYTGPFKSRFRRNQLNFKERPRLYQGMEVFGKENHELVNHLPPGSTIIKLEPGMPVPPGAIRISPYQFQNLKHDTYHPVNVPESLPIQYPLNPNFKEYGTLSTKDGTVNSNLSNYSYTSEDHNQAPATVDQESQASTFSSCDSYNIQIQLPKM